MKKLLIVLMVMVSLFAVGCEDGSYLSNTPQMKSDAVSRLEATGIDLRVYEFTPKSDPHQAMHLCCR